MTGWIVVRTAGDVESLFAGPYVEYRTARTIADTATAPGTYSVRPVRGTCPRDLRVRARLGCGRGPERAVLEGVE